MIEASVDENMKSIQLAAQIDQPYIGLLHRFQIASYTECQEFEHASYHFPPLKIYVATV